MAATHGCRVTPPTGPFKRPSAPISGGARGFETRTAASDWLIPGSATSLTRLFVAMAAGPARQAMPAQAAKFTAWSRARLDQAARARLAIRIGHRDILAFPRGAR